ncbi:MAG TPA: sodium:solute symporter [Bacteroidetes bacterium]|nr:sodium:solute symporter [Bacteroidota bacterium]
MNLSTVDILIILLYLISITVIGLLLKKRAHASKNNYMLGGNNLPWYMLGLSNASGMFDISGTMWLVTLGFVYGLKSIWIPWLWPVFNQVFLMVFLSAWLRKSNATTGAEWMQSRFGTDRGSKLSHTITVVFALISCLGFLAYGFIGLGKFVQIFLPWDLVAPFIPFDVPAEFVTHVYGIIFTLFAVTYSILGGMASIVWADLVQYIIMTISSILIAYIAMMTLTTQTLIVPDGWMNPFFGLNLDLNWVGIIPEVNDKIASDGYELFSIFFMLVLFKGMLVSLAGPAPNYDMQKILSTKSPSEAAKMSGFVSVVLMPVRYLMITGFVVLGILYYDQLNLLVAGRIDFEQILPSAINEFVPTGFLGLLLAGLLAAFISTFAGTLNAAQAYIVNDIYIKYIKPDATNKQISTTNYISGSLVVVVSIVFGVFAMDVNSVLQWLVSALFGSYVVSNILKWYWWRLNGTGYFWGMVGGIVPALILPTLMAGTLDLYYFPIILVVSIGSGIAGTFLTPPTDMETLKSFYKTVRPWGFWGPVKQLCLQEDPNFRSNPNFKRDMMNVALGIVMQTSLVAFPIFLVLMHSTGMLITGAIILVLGYVLKRTWWDTLHEFDQ